ncbi:tetratricopeptide repeat protein [Novosphingobium aerophilum]|uniref:Tetratricopeptide repeat protein n=1 Tax=Novosphingobium aerophilum TaxID=2839843 RepID=A0A7X1F5M5_9SPHN|nr:hypothetical protein [Novosphingobium aerophilum]MBC2650773.1 hypothetical protein [Novosphingobium aerophilum]
MFPISSRAGGTFVSRAALTAALALGLAGGMVATAAPALAKEAKDAKAEGPKLSKAFITLAGPLQNDMAKAKDQASAAALKDKVLAALAAAQTVDDKFFAGNFAIQIGQTGKDSGLMKTGLETVIGSGKLTGPELGKYNYYLGGMAFDAKDYAGARTAFSNAVAAGYVENDVQALLAETYFATNELPKGLEVLGAAITARKAAGSVPPKEWYIRGLSVAYKAKTYEQAFGFGAGLVEAYPSTDNWADAIGLARTAGRFQAQETLDLMRLMDATGSYRDTSDYAEYLQAADARRAPAEVLKILDEGVKSGKLSPSDVFVNENKTIAQARLAADKASLPPLEKDALLPTASTATVMAAGDAFLSYDQWAKAEGFYQTALGKPGVDADRALTRLGIAQFEQGKFADAQATFGKVNGVRKPIAQLWAIFAGQKAKGG